MELSWEVGKPKIKLKNGDSADPILVCIGNDQIIKSIWTHISRIFVLNSKKVYTTPYSHQSSLMIYVFENYGYNFYSIMAF